MARIESHLDRFGRVVLPKAARTELGLAPGARLEVRVEQGEIRLREIGHAPIARRRGVLVVTAPAEEDLSRAVERLRHDRGRAVARVRSGRR